MATETSSLRERLVRALDTWLLVGLILAGSIAQLAWIAAGASAHHDTSRPGLPACVLLQSAVRLTVGTECNAVRGYCRVTRETTCSAVGPEPYLGAGSAKP